MPKTNKQIEFLETITFGEIESYYYRIDYWVQSNFDIDIDTAKEYLKETTFHGKVSSIDMAIYYADKHANYEDYIYYEYDFEFYSYIDHLAVQKEVANKEYIDIKNFIDYELLAEDIFHRNRLVNFIRCFKGNVFEITIEDTDEYIDIDVAEYCYLSVQKLIDMGLSIDDSISETYENFCMEGAK